MIRRKNWVYVYHYCATSMVTPGAESIIDGIIEAQDKIEGMDRYTATKKQIAEIYDLQDRKTTIRSLSFLHKKERENEL